MAKNSIKFGIVGFRTVGQGTLDVLVNNRENIFEKTGIDITVKAMADFKTDEIRHHLLWKVPVRKKGANDVINDKEVDLIVELIGGYTNAKNIVLRSLSAEKHFVTATKAPLAVGVGGKEIFRTAEDNNFCLGFEGSVGSEILTARVLKGDLAANNVKANYKEFSL